MRVTEVQCKTVLQRTSLGVSDYTLNAYQGCVFACSYCFVPVIRSFRHQEDELGWGEWVQVKVNAPEVLAKEMKRAKPEAKILIGTATDSWQPLEKRYEISRRILQILAEHPNHVHVLTRSPLLIRDIDVLKSMPDVSLGVSLPSFDERARRVFEPHAPAIAGRVNLVRRLMDAGLPVTLFWCPILYGVGDTVEAVEDYLRKAAALGIKKIHCDTMNYTNQLAKPHMQLLRLYREGSDRRQPPSLGRAALSREIARVAAEVGVECAL